MHTKTATDEKRTERPDGPARIPMFLGNHALRSLRDSGFSLPGALGEPIDNSLESRANHVAVELREGQMGKKRYIESIVIADDGRGMSREVLSRYLQIGFSTRYMSTSTIGKYGVGAKLAALSLARRIDVWSRESASEPWLHVAFDLDAVVDGEDPSPIYIEAPDQAPIPEDLRDVTPAGSGTIVLWSKVDRLEEGRRAMDTNRLRVDVERELSRMFRAFLEGGIRITVNGKALLPYDPLFLMEGSWSDHVLSKHYAPAEGEPELRHFPAAVIADENITIDGSVARLRVTVYPREVLRQRFMGGDELADRLRIPGSQGNISFMRMNREINYALVPRMLPSGVKDLDRFIGIEVSFTPELDLHFGVRNVKRGVEPDERLRAEIRERLAKYIPTARKRIKEVWSEADRAEKTGEHDPIVRAAAGIDITLPKGRVQVEKSEIEREQILDDLARDIGAETEEQKQNYLKCIRNLPFVLESVDWPGYNLLDIQHTSEQAIIRLNSRHRFYRELWAPIKRMAEAPEGTVSEDEMAEMARRALEALTLMVLAYAKAETMHPNPHEQYAELRDYWGMFLHHLLGKVKDVV